jgi:cytochrome c
MPRVDETGRWHKTGGATRRQAGTQATVHPPDHGRGGMRRHVFAVLIGALLPTAAIAAEGRQVFEHRCASCHAAVVGAPPGPGPGLAGVVGRRVAGDPEFDYSPVLQAAREAGEVWDAARLDRFLADPEAMFPGLWMGANGLRDVADRGAVVAFLAGTSSAD